MDETIKVTGLSKSYTGNKVIRNIALSIGTGQVFGLLGANGLRYKLKRLSSTSLR